MKNEVSCIVVEKGIQVEEKECVKMIGGFYPEDAVIPEQYLHKSPNIADFGVIIIENSNKKKCSDCAVIGQISLPKEAIDIFQNKKAK